MNPPGTAPAPRASCENCLAWGPIRTPFTRGLCWACYMFLRDHRDEIAGCTGCRREQPLRKGYCRSCWNQARAQARAAENPRRPVTAMDFLGQVTGHHQLFFADMLDSRGARTTPVRRYDRRGAPAKPPPPMALRPQAAWVQPFLFDRVVRDYTRFDPVLPTDPDNPWLAWALHLAHLLAEARGWKRSTRDIVERELTIVLSSHVEGDVVLYSEIYPALRAIGLPVERTAEVLQQMGVLVDDRQPSFEAWLPCKLDAITPAIADDTESWLRTLRDGGARTRPRSLETVRSYANLLRPLLLDWSAHYDHLREITRDDVKIALSSLHGTKRQTTLVALRSLFSWAKRNKTIFRDPTLRIKVGERDSKLIKPLSARQIADSVTASTTPVERLVLALAAIHAARPAQIRALQLDDVDLGNRRLTINGKTRPLDELTYQALLDWLTYRQAHWPNTANPHLIINRMSAQKTSQVSTLTARKTLRGAEATLGKLRVDRQLDEALTTGADPLHLAEVFKLDEKTAIRYARAARALLEGAIEQTRS